MEQKEAGKGYAWEILVEFKQALINFVKMSFCFAFSGLPEARLVTDDHAGQGTVPRRQRGQAEVKLIFKTTINLIVRPSSEHSSL